MSVLDLTLEPLGQFLASGDSSWLWKRSGNSGLLSCAPDFVRPAGVWTYLHSSTLTPWTP
ncbi:hypothetical protein SCLCIDRAFT_30085 [Scleroderma citrinum Foug A]|uniref:Uncharacterized protein n=1 Tax=Scleroderma citrinum Foug A TaxID=1036808 RepID=A0A0C3DIC9_9AGAM|nr:hypothetical protein SCLCIDRAFT_30085 [Scleroderma citrinum Foug A]